MLSELGLSQTAGRRPPQYQPAVLRAAVNSLNYSLKTAAPMNQDSLPRCRKPRQRFPQAPRGICPSSPSSGPGAWQAATAGAMVRAVPLGVCLLLIGEIDAALL